MPSTDPEAILAFWFADAASDPAAAKAREQFWFSGGERVDALVRERFAPAIDAAARGEIDAWAREPRGALARVIVLDQFPRNLFRGTARAFASDGYARRALGEALEAGHFARLRPIEQAFLLLPLQHSESLEHQRESVRLSQQISREAAPAWRPLLDHYLDYAREHLALIERFGRFPHRNRVLGRTSTPEEEGFLAGGGESYGQGGEPA